MNTVTQEQFATSVEMQPEKSVRVTDLTHAVEGNWQILSGVIHIRGRQYPVWYRVSTGPLADGSETFLAAALLFAMKAGAELHIPGRVSAKLLRNLNTVQDIFYSWNRSFQKVPVQVASSSAEGLLHQPRGIGCFFSGGVDSFYSFFKHREEITHLIFVHGHDLALDDYTRRKRVSQHFQHLAQHYGKTLIEVETNLRLVADPYVDWAHWYHGAFMASIALLLKPVLGKVFIAATGGYEDLAPWGSHPLLDPLWSTEAVEVVHDGSEATRFEKVAAIAGDNLALQSLRVCLKNSGPENNCGCCEKCLRTMVVLRILGVLDRCPVFDRPLDLAKVARIDTSIYYIKRYTQMNLEALNKIGKDEGLEEALRDSLSGLYKRGIPGWPQRGVKYLRRYLKRMKR